MILALIFFIGLFVGFIGMAVVVLRKLFALKLKNGKPTGLIASIIKKPRNGWIYQYLNIDKLLRKMLMRAKIVFLKGENKIDIWLERISSSKKFNEDYWKKVRKK